jgi:hypothetical protein
VYYYPVPNLTISSMGIFLLDEVNNNTSIYGWMELGRNYLNMGEK